jgi:O-antigen chain-terminating methyltransferase
MVRFRGMVKKVATLTAKIVVYLSSFITERQRTFNQASVSAARLMTDAVNILDAQLTSVRGELASVRGELASVRGELASLRRETETSQRMHMIDIDPVFETTEESYVRRAVARSAIDPERLAAAGDNDVSYYLFENIFYDPEVVTKKQEMYLKYVNRSLSHAYSHLDIGCGRGEFLRILSREHIQCKGVDVNELEVSLLREQGFDVICSDALSFLRTATETFSGISALQFIEHVDVGYATEFINRAFQALAVNGVLVIETVNPHSPYAMANFFQDMTHLKPYPPEMMQFLLEWHGFEDVTVVYSSPAPKWARVLTDQRDGPDVKTYYQDYAVIGYKKRPTRPPLSEI